MRWIAAAVAGSLGLASAASAQTTQTYVYDVQGRAIAATAASGSAANFATYNYDPTDNRTVRRSQTFATPATPSQLVSGEYMVLQQALPSADYRFQFSVQSDGNLVVYFGSTVLWQAATYGTSATFLAMQTDGNLVLYGPNYSVIWQSMTGTHPGAHLVMQNDGNLVIYDGSTLVWQTSTCCH